MEWTEGLVNFEQELRYRSTTRAMRMVAAATVETTHKRVVISDQNSPIILLIGTVRILREEHLIHGGSAS